MWTLVWIIGSVIPVVPYAVPLWNHALADTPYAYLIWIPVFAFLWAGYNLLQSPNYKDDSELNGILGTLLIVFSGALLVAGMTRWSQAFVANDAGLLIWPLWALGLAWLMFGVGTTGRLIRPLSYMMLAWPPIYTAIVNLTNPVLYGLSNYVVKISSHWVSWLLPTPPDGTYLVSYHGTWVQVAVSTACSGGDSFLAMIILLPVILVAFSGQLWKKFILIAIGGALTIVMNLIRVASLIASVHWFGGNFTFGVLHPTSGLVLFIFILGLLALAGKALRLQAISSKSTGSLSVPGWPRVLLTLGSAGTLTFLLFPLYGWAAGSLRAPIPVSTDKLSELMPQIPNFERNLLGVYNEASVLGPGSYGTAYAYSNPQGQYNMAEMWWSYNLSALDSYGVNDCLLFHGNDILATQSFQLMPGITAHAFAVLLPPTEVGGKRSLFEDVSYLYTVQYQGRKAYIRAEFATPISNDVAHNDASVQQMATSLLKHWGTTSSSATPDNLPALAALNFIGFHEFIANFSNVSLRAANSSPTSS